MLREKAKKRKLEKQEEVKKQIFDQISEGESVDSDDHDHGEEPQKERDNGDLFKAYLNEKPDDSEDDLLVPAKEQTLERDDGGEEKKDLVKEAKNLKKMMKLVKKIKPDGPFGGKNRQLLDMEGQAI